MAALTIVPELPDVADVRAPARARLPSSDGVRWGVWASVAAGPVLAAGAALLAVGSFLLGTPAIVAMTGLATLSVLAAVRALWAAAASLRSGDGRAVEQAALAVSGLASGPCGIALAVAGVYLTVGWLVTR